MSRANKQFSKQLVTLARQAGGSFKTVADRTRIAKNLAERMLHLNIQIRDVKNIKTAHIETYIHSRQVEGIAKRTLQNEMAALRGILATAGRSKLACPQHEKLSNEALGLSGASRDGKKVAISDERYRAALVLAMHKDEGVAAAMQLARYLGLRTEEAVQSAKSVKTWLQALEKGEEKVRIIFGTKGGRARDTTIVKRELVLQALKFAVKQIDKQGGRLVNRAELKSAITRYRNVTASVGLTGKYSPHSLRYAFSVEATNFHRGKGLSQQEAEAMTSMDLGHGDGRGHYVARVYNKVE